MGNLTCIVRIKPLVDIKYKKKKKKGNEMLKDQVYEQDILFIILNVYFQSTNTKQGLGKKI